MCPFSIAQDDNSINAPPEDDKYCVFLFFDFTANTFLGEYAIL